MIVKGVTSSYLQRSKQMRQKILRTIEQVISASKGNIGIFTVSYKFLNKLRKTKIDQQNLQKICEKYKKKYFQEERGLTSQENALLIEDFKALRAKGKEMDLFY